MLMMLTQGPRLEERAVFVIWELHKLPLFPFCWQEFSHVATPSFKFTTLEDEETHFGELSVFHGSHSR